MNKVKNPHQSTSKLNSTGDLKRLHTVPRWDLYPKHKAACSAWENPSMRHHTPPEKEGENHTLAFPDTEWPLAEPSDLPGQSAFGDSLSRTPGTSPKPSCPTVRGRRLPLRSGEDKGAGFTAASQQCCTQALARAIRAENEIKTSKLKEKKENYFYSQIT